MDKRLSVYLDAMRFAAAMLVFLNHLSFGRISHGFLWQFDDTGHDGVIVFFVLSGFVIANVADTKEQTLADYAASRLARLYSVLIPALFLTCAADFVGISHNSVPYDLSQETWPAARLTASSLFLSEIWFFHFQPLSNGPYWSLPYEFWYYVMFGCVMFLRGRFRWISVALAATIAGPNILLLLPVWIVGATTYWLLPRFRLSRLWAITGALMSASFVVAVVVGDSRDLIPRVLTDVRFSPVDYLTGFAVALNIVCISTLRIRLPAENFIRHCAGRTFALYMFHMPLLSLAAAYIPSTISAYVRGPIIGVFALIVVFSLGGLVEGWKRPLRHRILQLIGVLCPQKIANV
jgi:peptidoglycan/LPS O-acetylase OafA/YrhL